MSVVGKRMVRLTFLGVIFEIGDCGLVLDHYEWVSSVGDAEMELAWVFTGFLNLLILL